MKKNILLFIFLSIAIFFNHELWSQEVITIDPLFEYPVAPEELESLEDRCNYVVRNFWNSFDFKSKKALDQHALNEAFKVYVAAFPYASAKYVDMSLEKLLKNISSSPGMLLQFCNAAEENLYGPRASFWSDETYIKFLDSVLKNKKISDTRKTKFNNQKMALENSMIGAPASSFWFEDKERASRQYFPMSTPTLLIFGNPEDVDWRLHRIKLDSDVSLNDAIAKGKVNVIFIVPGSQEGWQKTVDNYNDKWVVGQSSDVIKNYDLRLSPAIYVVGADGKIKVKNVHPEEAVERIMEMIDKK